MAVDEQIPEAQEPGGEQPAEQLAPPVNENYKWYIIHAYSGFERKVRESLESRIQAFGLQNRIGRIMIPTEPVTELRNGKKYTIERVFLPGYVLVEMELDNDLWHVIKNTPRVTGFLGTGDKPVALSEAEVSSILFRSESAKDKPSMQDQVREGRAGAHQRRAVRQLQRHGGRRQRRPPDAEGDGLDLRPLHAGRDRVRQGRQDGRVASVAPAPCRQEFCNTKSAAGHAPAARRR